MNNVIKAADTKSRIEALKEELHKSKMIVDTYKSISQEDCEEAKEHAKKIEEYEAEIERLNREAEETRAQEASEANVRKAIVSGADRVMNDDIKSFLEEIFSGKYEKIKTGVDFIDTLFDGGIPHQTFIVLLAETGIGKTALCQQIAESIAAQRKRVLYINLEMSKAEMIARTLSRKIKKQKDLSANQILNAKTLSEEEQEIIKKAAEEYGNEAAHYLKYVDNGAGHTIQDIEAYLKTAEEQAKANGEEAPAIIFDYLHLIDGAEEKETLKKSVELLKRYAMQNNTFVIGISAANREASKTGLITLESGRDSSSIEYQADIVFSINYAANEQEPNASGKTAKQLRTPKQEEELKKQEPKSLVIRTLKYRRGNVGSANVRFYKNGLFEKV